MGHAARQTYPVMRKRSKSLFDSSHVPRTPRGMDTICSPPPRHTLRVAVARTNSAVGGERSRQFQTGPDVVSPFEPKHGDVDGVHGGRVHISNAVSPKVSFTTAGHHQKCRHEWRNVSAPACIWRSCSGATRPFGLGNENRDAVRPDSHG